MTSIILSNAFSLNMLDTQEVVLLKVKKLDLKEVKKIVESNEIKSCIGHSGTAEVLSILLEREIPMNRIPITLKKGEKLLVFQIRTRLEEGKILSAEEVQKLPYEFYMIELL